MNADFIYAIDNALEALEDSDTGAAAAILKTVKKALLNTDPPAPTPIPGGPAEAWRMAQVRQIAREYAWPNSNIDAGNLYFALHVALAHIDAKKAHK